MHLGGAHQRVQDELFLCALQDLFLNAARRYESVDFDRLRLTESVTSCFSLQVVLRVPVRVIDDDCVGCGEVDSGWRARKEADEAALAVCVCVCVWG